MLIEAGAQLDALAAPDAGGVPGGSALLHAAVFGMTDALDAQRGRAASVRRLLARGADPALTDHHGRTPLDLRDDAEVAALLTAAANRPSG